MEHICPGCGKPTAADVFSGEGGATKGLMDAGFCVTAIDNDENRLRYNPAPHKVLGDAVEFLANEGHRFAFRWASPTCTGYSRGTAAIPDRVGKYDRLIAATREALLLHDGPWVIENVEDAAHLGEIRDPQMLCGRMFGLGADDLDGEPLTLDRHRVFEATFSIGAPAHATHGDEVVAGAYGGGRRAKRRPQETIVELAARDRYEAKYVRKGGYVPRDQGVLERMLGITWEMTQKGVYLCIPPIYAQHIGLRAMATIEQSQETLCDWCEEPDALGKHLHGCRVGTSPAKLFECPRCSRVAAWTDGIEGGGDVPAEFWCQTCGAEVPLDHCRQVAA